MTTENTLSPTAQTILEALRKHRDGGYTENVDGSRWYDTYLNNARPPGMNAHAFAGHLSALTAAGVYKDLDGYAFGRVLVQVAEA